MEIKTVILGEVTQRPRITNIICFLSFMGVSIEASDTCFFWNTHKGQAINKKQCGM